MGGLSKEGRDLLRARDDIPGGAEPTEGVRGGYEGVVSVEAMPFAGGVVPMHQKLLEE